MRCRDAACSDAASIARIHVDSWRTTYRGVIPDDVLARLSYAARQAEWESGLCHPDGAQIVFVAEDPDDGIVGFACGGPERTGDPLYQGELYAIYILESHQRRGIGQELTRRVAGRLIEAGLTGMQVWVLVDNPSRGFYEKLGGLTVRTRNITFGNAQLEEVAYGWRNLRDQPWIAVGSPKRFQ
ncbi:MAG: GNAT family N-acetyltransferase [Chloroflexota bacterium]